MSEPDKSGVYYRASLQTRKEAFIKIKTNTVKDANQSWMKLDFRTLIVLHSVSDVFIRAIILMLLLKLQIESYWRTVFHLYWNKQVYHSNEICYV